MYRRYENPGKVQELLRIAEAVYEKAIAEGADDDRLFDLYGDVLDLKDRLRFAWADQEEEENYRRDNYPEEFQ